MYSSFLPHMSNQSKYLVGPYQFITQATSLDALKFLSIHCCSLPLLDQQKFTKPTGWLLEDNDVLILCESQMCWNDICFLSLTGNQR